MNKNGKIKWYYQTMDYKIHNVKGEHSLSDFFNSEVGLKKFFDDKICLGCRHKGNFVEIDIEENFLHVSLGEEETCIYYNNYDELVKLFTSNCKKMQQTKKVSKINVIPLYLISVVLYFSGLILKKTWILGISAVLLLLTDIIEGITERKIRFRHLDSVYYDLEPVKYIIILVLKAAVMIFVGYFIFFKVNSA